MITKGVKPRTYLMMELLLFAPLGTVAFSALTEHAAARDATYIRTMFPLMHGVAGIALCPALDLLLYIHRRGTVHKARAKNMRVRAGSRSHTKTKFIELDRRRCQACWKCVESCPNHVLGKVAFFNHRHAKVNHAEACKGCKKCVDSCPNQAIRYTYVPPSHRPTNGPAQPLEQPRHFDSDDRRALLA